MPQVRVPSRNLPPDCCKGCGVRWVDEPGHQPGSTACKAERAKRRSRAKNQRSCYTSYGEPKVRHTPDSAAEAIRHALEHHGTVVRSYPCPHCGHLHVGRARAAGA